MNIDLTKVIAEAIEIFVAIRAAEGTVTANPSLAVVIAGGDGTWKKIGACKKKSTKLVGQPYTTEEDGGLEATHGGTGILTARNIEMSSAQTTLLETFENKVLDVICRVKGKTKAYKFPYCSMVKSTDMPFNQEESQGNDLRFKKDYDLWSTALTNETLS